VRLLAASGGVNCSTKLNRTTAFSGPDKWELDPDLALAFWTRKVLLTIR